MSAPPGSIFISSVQKEQTKERRAVKAFIENDPCDVYIGLFGNDYGFEGTEGLSPTEREFNRATIRGKPRLIFVKGKGDKHRHPKMQNLIRKAGSQLIRQRFNTISELNEAIYASLVDHLESCGIIQSRTTEVIESLGVNDRQIACLNVLKAQQQIMTMEYQHLVGCSRRTAARDLDELLDKGVIQRQGAGRSAHYVLGSNRAIGYGHDLSRPWRPQSCRKRAKCAIA
jgi:hypothetical protein